MYQRILVAIDGSRAARLALDEAVKLAHAASGTIMAVYVVENIAQVVDLGTGLIDMQPGGAAAEERARAALEEATELFAQHHLRGETRQVDAYGEGVTDALSRVADDWDADVVVMGSHGRHGVQRALFGSVAEAFLRSSKLPVLLVRHDPAAM